MARAIDSGPGRSGPAANIQGASLETQVYEALIEAAEAMSYEVGRALSAFDLSVPQFQVLRVLEQASPAGLLVHEAAQRVPARAPNITRLADKLESKGLVRRARSEVDRRAVHLHITERGRECLDLVAAPVDEAMARPLSSIPEGDLLVLRTLLGRLIAFPVDGSQTKTRRNGRDTH